MYFLLGIRWKNFRSVTSALRVGYSYRFVVAVTEYQVNEPCESHIIYLYTYVGYICYPRMAANEASSSYLRPPFIATACY
jgi:hypothetical protein